MISGSELRKEREAAGVSAGAVAREMGVSRQFVSKMENVKSTAGIEVATRIRLGIEAALARKEGRELVKQVPQFCPIDDEEMVPNFGMKLVEHLDRKHHEREVIVSGSGAGPNPRLSGWISSQSGRRGWIVLEGPTTFSVVFADYPYSVMSFPFATYKYEPVNVKATPEKETTK